MDRLHLVAELMDEFTRAENTAYVVENARLSGALAEARNDVRVACALARESVIRVRGLESRVLELEADLRFYMDAYERLMDRVAQPAWYRRYDLDEANEIFFPSSPPPEVVDLTSPPTSPQPTVSPVRRTRRRLSFNEQNTE